MDQLDHTELELLGRYKAAVSPTASDRQANWAAIMAGIERGATSRFVESSSGERRRPVRVWALGGATLAAAAALVLVMSSDFSSSLLRGADTDAPGLLSLQADEAEREAAVTKQEPRRSDRPRAKSKAQQAATIMDAAPAMPTPQELSPSSEATSDEMLVGPQPPPEPQPPVQTKPLARKRVAAPPDPMEQLRQEAALIAKAREHLAAGRAGEALRAARGHRRRFAAGTLAEEAALIEVAALCEVGPEPAWRRALERFEDRFPNSPLRVHLRAECF